MIYTLKAKEENSKTEANAICLHQGEELREKQEASLKKLRDFKSSGNQPWGDI